MLALTGRRVTLLAAAAAGTLLLASRAEPGECTAASGTGCRLACLVGNEKLVCPAGAPSRCAMRCRSGSGPGTAPAECESGSGTGCRLTCDQGTFSLVCSRDGKGCKGRCRALGSARLAAVPKDHPAAFQPPGRQGPEPRVLQQWFLELVADIYDSLDRKRVAARPSHIAFAFHDALAKAERAEAGSTVQAEVAGDVVTVRLGVAQDQISRMREAVGPFLGRLGDSRDQQQGFDKDVHELLKRESLSAERDQVSANSRD